MARIGLVMALVLAAAGCGSGPPTVHAPTVIAWSQAEALLLDGRVATVVSLGGADARLELRDGRRVVVREPVEGEIRRVLERCGEPCANVVVR